MKEDPTRMGFSTDFDREIARRIQEVVSESKLPSDEILELWPLFTRRVHFLKLLALIEIFQIVKDKPGNVVECGVFKGQSLSLFYKLLETYCPGDSLKRIIGFDTFEGFVNLHKNDGPKDASRAKFQGGWDSKNFLSTLQQTLDLMQQDSYLPRLKRVELVQGDVANTIPEFVEKNPGLRISVLNLDLDLYEPTKVALKYLYPLVVNGGVVILDEYAMTGFPGESKAFDEYFGSSKPTLIKFPYTPTPGGYFIKS